LLALKTCSVCKLDLPATDFYKQAETKDGLSYRCKKCVREYKVKLNNDTKYATMYARAYVLARKHPKLSLDLVIKFYQEHFTGKCDICSKVITGKDMHLDHNHTTGVLRGWLCMLCNTGLGKFKDNPDLLRKALSYLEQR